VTGRTSGCEESLTAILKRSSSWDSWSPRPVWSDRWKIVLNRNGRQQYRVTPCRDARIYVSGYLKKRYLRISDPVCSGIILRLGRGQTDTDLTAIIRVASAFGLTRYRSLLWRLWERGMLSSECILSSPGWERFYRVITISCSARHVAGWTRGRVGVEAIISCWWDLRVVRDRILTARKTVDSAVSGSRASE